MYTLQILDRGQTFLYPIDSAAILFGSGKGADVVLREEGVAAAHARVEPHGDGARLVALAPTLVNGVEVTRTELALGDRIEIGRAVLVVGRAVTRAASADDVLKATLPGTRRRPAKRSKLVPAFGVVGALGLGALLLFGGPSRQVVRDELAALQRWRAAGQLERATARIDALEREWRDAEDDRLQQLAAERAAIAAIDTAAARLTKAVLDPADQRGYAEWSQELQRLEHEGAADERVAARRVRSNLAATLLERPKRRVDGAAGAAAGASPSLATGPATTRNGGGATPSAAASSTTTAPLSASSAAGSGAGAPAAIGAPAGERSAAAANAANAGAVTATAKIDPREAERLAAQGLFAPAIALLDASLGEQDSEGEVARLRTRRDAVRDRALQAMATLLDEARGEVRGGDAREGAKLLQAARHRFPPSAEFVAIDEEIRRCDALAAARPVPGGAGGGASGGAAAPVAPGQPVDAATRTATLAAVRAFMDNVRLAEEQAAFAAAAQHLRTAADAVRDRDADFAARLQQRADEAELLAAWHDAVAAALAGGRTLTTTRADGQPVTLDAVDGAALRAGPARLNWHDIGAVGVQALVQQLEPRGTPALGASALLYRQGQGPIAEKLLAGLLRADPASKAGVDRVIARGRGEPLDGGYTLGKDGAFQSVRSVEVGKQAVRLAARLDAALRDKNPAARDVLWQETLAAGPDAVQVLVAAMQQELRKNVARLDAGALRKQVDKLAAQRAVLDTARASAKELIFDEKKYFSPYKPPAVSSDRYSEYLRVQAEIDRRVAVLRTTWNDDRTRVRVAASLRSDLDRIDWLANGLAELGELDHGVTAAIEWARALPPGDTVGLRDFCVDATERATWSEWRHVEAYNTIVGKQLTSAQREQLKVTNEYRAMFGHRPLAVVPTICAAAQGHAEEMSRLGYFAHQSPTPGRETPFDRMKLAGYTSGVSENIALVDGATGAHIAWCHSSGHHRNLLDAGHREFGIGADGRYWVQNFGSGQGHREDPAWEVARATIR